MANILINVPSGPHGMVFFQTCQSLIASTACLLREGHSFGIGGESAGTIVYARNFGVAQVLREKQWTHLWFVDSDMSWAEPDSILKMLKANKPVVAGMYCSRGDKPFWCARPGDMGPEVNGLRRGIYMPTGFMLIKREVFEILAGKRPDLKIRFNDMVADEPYNYLFFDQRRSRDGSHYIGEDYGFCENWADAGGEIWCYTDITFGHHGTRANVANFANWSREHEDEIQASNQVIETTSPISNV